MKGLLHMTLRSQPREADRVAASNPESPADVLLRQAEAFPEEVLANPALGLIALSEPKMWLAIERTARETIAWRRVDTLVPRASPGVLLLFVAARLERLLPFWESNAPQLSLVAEESPDIHGLRDVLAHLRREAQGQGDTRRGWCVNFIEKLMKVQPDRSWSRMMLNILSDALQGRFRSAVRECRWIGPLARAAVESKAPGTYPLLVEEAEWQAAELERLLLLSGELSPLDLVG